MSNDDTASRMIEPATVPSRIQRGSPADSPPLRLRMSATVVKGFGRGSKLLGIPTANMDMKEIGQKVNDTPTGIYLGYTMLEGVVYKAVVSIGWNPYFDNSEKTVEPHLLHKFDEDFYGEKLHLLLCGFIRNELNFNSLEDLIAAIGDDIRYAKRKFEEPEVASLAVDDPFWEDVAKGGSSILGDDDREGDNDDDGGNDSEGVNDNDDDGEGVTLGSYKKNNDSGSNGDVTCTITSSSSNSSNAASNTINNTINSNDGNTAELEPTATSETESTCIVDGTCNVGTADTTSNNSNSSSAGNSGTINSSSGSGNNNNQAG